MFGPKTAAFDLRRYRKRGPDAVTRLLLAEVRRHPLENSTLLDIGGGIGVIGQELHAQGLPTSTLVEASPAYLAVAGSEIQRRGLAGKIRLVAGDFVALAGEVEPADIVTLNRVVCCYPDADGLLARAAERSRRVLAFTYPRDRWYVRLGSWLTNLWCRISGSPFRSFIHSAARLEQALVSKGLERRSRQRTLIWTLEVYQR